MRGKLAKNVNRSREIYLGRNDKAGLCFFLNPLNSRCYIVTRVGVCYDAGTFKQWWRKYSSMFETSHWRASVNLGSELAARGITKREEKE
jgi:hypothetical protein